MFHAVDDGYWHLKIVVSFSLSCILQCCFVFDGTLFDTMSVWDTAGEDYLKQCGKVPRENLCEVLKPKSLSGAAEYLKKNYDLPLSVNEIVDGVNKTVGDFYLCEAQPKNGVREFLTALREINVRMCITTAAER